MDITTFLAQATTELVPMADLSRLAADRKAFGDDLLEAFQAQIELRARAAQRVIDEAHTAERDLLASEQRMFDRAIRERDEILGLLRHVEQRTAAAYRVPDTQPTTPAPARHVADAPTGPVVTREQRVGDWLQHRGGYLYAGERGVEALRFGAIVRALALGHRQGLTPLEQRLLAEGTDATGGYLVPEVLASQVIDRVRNAMAVMRAGAVTVPMASETLAIARVGQPGSVSPPLGTAAWKTENADIGETDLILERVFFTARTLPVLIKLSVELSEDAANVDQVIERELSQQLALELDRAALLGSGTPPEPKGIVNQTGVATTSFNGATPADYDVFVDPIGRLWGQNVEPTARIYNSALATVVAKLKSSVDAQPLRAPDVVTAVPAYRTNQIPNDGGSPDTTTLFVGDFSQLLIGMRTSFKLEVTRVAGEAFEKLQVWVRAYLRADVQLAHPEAFDVTTDVGIG